MPIRLANSAMLIPYDEIEFLERVWDSIVLLKTLERDVPIQVPPMEAGEANGIFLPFLI